MNGLNFAEIGMAWVDLSEPRVHVQSYVLQRMPTAQRVYICGSLLCCAEIPRDFTRLQAYFFLFSGTQYVDSNKIFLKIGECLLLDS